MAKSSKAAKPRIEIARLKRSLRESGREKRRRAQGAKSARTACAAGQDQVQKLKLKALRQKQPAAKAAAKAKPQARARSARPSRRTRPTAQQQERAAPRDAEGGRQKALEKVQAAHQSRQEPRAKAAPALPGKKSTRGLTAKEKALVKEFERRELSPADAEARRMRLKNLIVLGKERSSSPTPRSTTICPTTCWTPSRSRTSSA